MHPEQVKIKSNTFDIFINKYADVQLSVSRPKKLQKLLKKDVFKVITLDKIVIPEEILSTIQVLNSSLVDNIKDLYTDKAYEKNCPVLHIYNNEKENVMLIFLPKILRVNQDTGSCFTTIIQNNNNNNQ